MDVRYILALDPGKTTGWAHYDRETGEFTSGQTTFAETCALLFRQAELGSEVLIVSESFIITQQTVKNTQSPWSLELIGVARAISQMYGQRDLTLQSPANAKRFMSNDRLRTLGWYAPKNMGHANDAARHLGLLMATRGWFSQETLRSLVKVG